MNDNEKDIYVGRNRTEQLFRKIKSIATYIAKRDGIDIKEATEQYEKTEHYQKLMASNTDLLEKTEIEVVADYMLNEEIKKESYSDYQDRPVRGHVFPLGETTSNEENSITDLLENYHCMIGDIDFGPTIKSKAKQVAQIISSQKGISYDEAYRMYIRSKCFHDLEDFDKHMLIKSEAELAVLFLNELEGVKEEKIEPKRI